MTIKQNITELVDRVEQMFDEKPDGRKKLELKDWTKEINILIDIINNQTKSKIYKTIVCFKNFETHYFIFTNK